MTEFKKMTQRRDEWLNLGKKKKLKCYYCQDNKISERNYN